MIVFLLDDKIILLRKNTRSLVSAKYSLSIITLVLPSVNIFSIFFKYVIFLAKIFTLFLLSITTTLP